MNGMLDSNTVAKFLNGQLVGKNIKIVQPCSLNKPKPASIAFATSPEILNKIDFSDFHDVTILLPTALPKTGAQPASAIIVANPRLAFAKVLTAYFETKTEPKIADTAKIGRDVSIGCNVTIGEFCVLSDGVKVGDNSTLQNHVVIDSNVSIGQHCTIKSHSVIGEPGFGIEKDENGDNHRIPHVGSVVVGDNVEIGTFNTICAGTIDPTTIADFVKIDDHVHVGHNVTIGQNTIITACVQISGSVAIGQNVWISPRCAIIDGIKVEDDVFIGIGALVTKDCSHGQSYAGSPARVLKRSQE